jgi:hypothetical protein
MIATALRSFWILMLLGASYAFAEFERFGPITITPHVNTIDVPLTLNALIDVNSSKGDFNVKGEIVASSPTSQLGEKVIAISEKILPLQIPTSMCELWLNKVSRLNISSEDYEIRLDGSLIFSVQRCGFFNTADREIPLKLGIIAVTNPNNELRWKIVRRPDMILPTGWSTLISFLEQGNAADYVKDKLQKFLDDFAAIHIPTSITGVRTSLNGANFNGNTNILYLRVKGDVHSDGKNLATILAPYVNKLPLEYSIRRGQLPKQ